MSTTDTITCHHGLGPAHPWEPSGYCPPEPVEPAPDTETETQWGVRRPDGKHLDWDQEPTDSERRRIEARGDTVVKQHVTRTPWEEA